MKKANILAAVVTIIAIVCITVLLCIILSEPSQIDRQLDILKKEIKILRIVAEHRELLWKIQEYEKKLPQYQKKTAQAKPTIKPLYKGKEVDTAAVIVK